MTDYNLSISDTVLNHDLFKRKPPTVNDFAADLSKSDIDAIVASGDYFGMLATRLDSISQRLQADGNDPEHVNIEKIINALLYIETKYAITKK